MMIDPKWETAHVSDNQAEVEAWRKARWWRRWLNWLSGMAGGIFAYVPDDLQGLLERWPLVWRKRYRREREFRLEMMKSLQEMGTHLADQSAKMRERERFWMNEGLVEGRKAGYAEGLAAAETPLEKAARLACMSVARHAMLHRHCVLQRGSALLLDAQAQAVWANECGRTGRELDVALDAFNKALQAARAERKDNEARGKDN